MKLRGDEDPDTAFYVARDRASGTVVATASVQREAPPWEPWARHDRDHAGPEALFWKCLPRPASPLVEEERTHGASGRWRLRMAFAVRVLGRLVLAVCRSRRRSRRRTVVVRRPRPRHLVLRAGGLLTPGDFYEEPVVGTHVLMWRVVAPFESLSPHSMTYGHLDSAVETHSH